MKSSKPPKARPRSQLFTVRLWQENLGYDVCEVRWQVRHVLSGETRYFRRWQEAAPFLLLKLQESEAGQTVDREAVDGIVLVDLLLIGLLTICVVLFLERKVRYHEREET